MSPLLRTGIVWGGLGVGLCLVLSYIPKPGLGSPPRTAPASGLPPLQAGGGEEQFAFALASMGAGRLEEAMRLFDRAIAVDPAFAPAYVHKAYALALMEGTDPATLRSLLSEATRRGFDRGTALANEARMIAQGGIGEGVGRFHLERAVLLGFVEPADPAAALEALAEARAAGFPFPKGLEAALASQVQPPAGR